MNTNEIPSPPEASTSPELPDLAIRESQPSPAEDIPTKIRLDPTRYGDWELNGKCVDF